MLPAGLEALCGCCVLDRWNHRWNIWIWGPIYQTDTCWLYSQQMFVKRLLTEYCFKMSISCLIIIIIMIIMHSLNLFHEFKHLISRLYLAFIRASVFLSPLSQCFIWWSTESLAAQFYSLLANSFFINLDLNIKYITANSAQIKLTLNNSYIHTHTHNLAGPHTTE